MSLNRGTIFQSFLNKTLDLKEVLSFDAISNINDFHHGKTLLHYAIELNQFDLVQLLLKHPDIDVNIKDTDGGTPLRYALRRSRYKIFEFLLQQKNLDLNADVLNNTDSKLKHVHYEQPIALDLGRRGTLKMIEIWVKNQGEEAWNQRGSLDKATEQRWSFWKNSKQSSFSAIDCALLEPNLPILAYLLKNTNLSPLPICLEYPIHNDSIWDKPNFLSHPGHILMKAMGDKESLAFWDALSKDKSHDNTSRAQAILNWIEKKRLHQHLPHSDILDRKKIIKNRI